MMMRRRIDDDKMMCVTKRKRYDDEHDGKTKAGVDGDGDRGSGHPGRRWQWRR